MSNIATVISILKTLASYVSMCIQVERKKIPASYLDIPYQMVNILLIIVSLCNLMCNTLLLIFC